MNRRARRLIAAVYTADQRPRYERHQAGSLERDDAQCLTFARLLAGGANRLVASDAYRLALVFHHGQLKEKRAALTLAWAAHRAGYKKAGWLVAAITDSILLWLGRPQRFGTQFKLDRRRAAWIRQPTETPSARVAQLRTELGLPRENPEPAVVPLRSI